MAVVKDNKDKDPMTDETLPGDESRPEREEPRKVVPQYATPQVGRGFFHIYKPGQGYWTRMGTVGGCALLLAMIGQFLFNQVARQADTHNRVWGVNATLLAAGIVGGVVLVSAVVLWWLLNKPTVVDFMVATESEMKKVNWTSRKELWGSTKVVIFFMFMIAGVLFGIDIIFGYFFWFIRVLQHRPF